ncbi:GMC oxidoreductase-domain-containing protein [Bombardia bombarda]|uniref:GMC oxidoreductase-domain-containing protein n=1 Tax=Bombardia bombarda TaxID=252184 RepID=A0AA40C8N4_9PEZI|nr:GMC oxidoreductase-domain-containing protein [Bombardia bombarda]
MLDTRKIEHSGSFSYRHLHTRAVTTTTIMILQTFLSFIFFSALFPSVLCIFLDPSNITDAILPSYDYIVVGGGLAGLVVANRLTEDKNVTVLVLEAGDLDSADNAVTVPAFVGHNLSPAYDWGIQMAPQEFLSNRTPHFPQGRVVGGGTVINGMVMTRGSRVDYDAWEELGNPGWGWQGLLPYLMKVRTSVTIIIHTHHLELQSETFVTDVDPEVASTFHIQPNMSTHGTTGPLEVAYPRFFYNQSSNFLRGLSELGIPLPGDPNAGAMAGGMINPSSMTRDRTRADSRTAYLNGVLNRTDLHLATGQTVTRILIGAGRGYDPDFGNLRRANGVEYTESATAVRQSVMCRREVILAAGAILSPVLLQVSGIGPTPILEDLNVDVQVNLPGVGQNLQDHGMVGAFYNYTAPNLFSTRNLTDETLSEAKQEYFTDHTGPWTAPLISTVAFLDLRSLASNWSSMIYNISKVPAEQHLPPGPGQHPSIINGYKVQRRLLQRLLSLTSVGAIEIMADTTGTLTASLQHPFSRGTVRARSADIFAGGSVDKNVVLDPRYCAQPEDCQIMVASLLFNGRLVGTDAMKELLPQPPAPWNMATAGSGLVANATKLLDAAVRSGLGTEFHPVGTTSMMPFDMGGVVDPRLMVYGTENLRVVNAGIIPLVPGAHLQASVYAIAERAADILKEDAASFAQTYNQKWQTKWKA